MTASEIVEEIRPLGTESYKKVMRNHGVPEPVFGVKIEDLKKIQKRVGKDYQLALDLFGTGIHDAKYLAGLVADDMRMTKKDLRGWAANAGCAAISEYTVPWVAAEGKHGRELALEWIESKKESIASSGWATLSSLCGIKDDADLDIGELKKLLERVRDTIHEQPSRVRHVMNCFVIALGSYVKEMTAAALEAARKIGKVAVDMGGTACKVPDIAEYIRKVADKGAIGKKRKTAKC